MGSELTASDSASATAFERRLWPVSARTSRAAEGRRWLWSIGGLVLAAVALTTLPAVAEDLQDQVPLFKNVNIFDGKSDRLIEGRDVLVVRNKIRMIAKNILTTPRGRPL